MKREISCVFWIDGMIERAKSFVLYVHVFVQDREYSLEHFLAVYVVSVVLMSVCDILALAS